MIHVIATIEVRPGMRDRFLAEFARLKPFVQAEEGCVEYGAAVGLENGLSSNRQYAWAPVRENSITIVEKWSSLDTWKAHLQSPHMDDYRHRSKSLVCGRTVQVLTPVD